MPCRPPILLALVCSLAVSCGGGQPVDGGIACTRDRDCPAGQGCINNLCAPLPCGGCQPDEACGSDGKCVIAQGATCANHTCPAGYPCKGTTCSKPCTLDKDCDTGSVCNSKLAGCSECVFDSECNGKLGKTHCDPDNGVCVACNVNFDCVKALGTGHYCEAHACKEGCKQDTDCNGTIGEKCDTAQTPGKCIQCKGNADCAAQGPGAQACDNSGHCVQCFGATQAQANTFCGSGTPECNLANKTCVQCLPANNQSGLDCGYSNNGAMDPHDAQTCDATTFSCVPGCKFDEQCGCPRTGPGSAESLCSRNPEQEHCDPNRLSMVGVTGPTQGACVQCYQDNAHCNYKRSDHGGTLNGARCVNDSCLEGCDTDADCPALHPLCHIGTSSSDPNNHKCVDCRCDVPGADPTWCDVTAPPRVAACADGVIHNPPNPDVTYPRVCDAQTLLCRKKRMSESCVHSNECGDTHDPTIGQCLPTPAICVYHSHSGSGVGSETYCAAGAQSGRCGVPCDDFFTNACAGGAGSCPTNSSCRQATGDASNAGAYCVATKCNCSATTCP